MTALLKRFFLIAATLVIIPLLGLSLWSSLTEPQITDRLQLYQTDLLLHVTELKADRPEDANLLAARKAVLGDNPLKTALDQYQEVRESATENLQKFQAQSRRETQKNRTLSDAEKPVAPTPPLVDTDTPSADVLKQQTLINQLDLRIGLLQAQQGNTAAALETWTELKQAPNSSSSDVSIALADVLTNLWQEPAQILPDTEALLQKNLEGWFRYVGLARLYQLQQRTEPLIDLQSEEQQIAQQTLIKLAAVSTVPAIGALIGVALIIGLGIRWLNRSTSTEPESLAWQVPWDWEVIAWVLVVGFFFAGQIAIPGILGLGSRFLNQVGVSVSLAAAVGGRAKAFYTLTYYLLMSSTGLFVLYRAVKPFSPLPPDWFRLAGKRNWFLWGLGGYFIALPLMFAVSLVNQQFWQGQGGSNPLLQIVLEEGDPVALLIFFLTAAVAAPIFEEVLFRGFLLPSLTRYLPVWGAIVASGFIFALAHLSLSEVLPLATLGIVLGVVYTRSRGLLASMLLHSLWNSVTMIGLFILGSGTK